MGILENLRKGAGEFVLTARESSRVRERSAAVVACSASSVAASSVAASPQRVASGHDPLAGWPFTWLDDEAGETDVAAASIGWPHWPAPGDAPAVPCDFCAACGGGAFWSDLTGAIHCCECSPIFSRRFFVELWEAAPFADDSARGYGLAWAYCRPRRWNPLAAIEAEERERRDRQQSGARQEDAW